MKKILTILFVTLQVVCYSQLVSDKGFKFDTLGLINKQTVVAYVDSLGNNATARLGNSAKPFSTIDRALDSLPSTGGVIRIGKGTFASPTMSKIKTGVVFLGSGKPFPNNATTVTGFPTWTNTTPTKLIGGTILQGTFAIPYNKEQITIRDMGVDCGSDYSPSTDTIQGLIFPQDYNAAGGAGFGSSDGVHRLQTTTTPRKGIIVENVSVLMKNATQLFHATIFENCINPYVKNLSTYFGNAGVVIKTIGGTYDGIETYGNHDYGIILRSHDYSFCNNVILTNFHIGSIASYDGAGLRLSTVTGIPLSNIQVRNGTILNTLTGVESEGNNINSSGIQISGVVVRGCSTSGFSLLNQNYLDIYNCRSSNNTGYGFNIINGTGRNTLNNCAADSNSIDGFNLLNTSGRLVFSTIYANNNSGWGVTAGTNVFGEAGSFVGNASGATTGTISFIGLTNGGIIAAAVAGGSSPTSTLSLYPTTGVGTTGADVIIASGTNGNTELARFKFNGTFGVGIASPVAGSFGHIKKDQNAQTLLLLENGTSGTAAQTSFGAKNAGGETVLFGINSAGYSSINAFTARSAYMYTATQAGIVLMADNAAGNIRFSPGGQIEKWRMSTAGNLSNTGADGTAGINLKAGTATASTAPLKFTSGTLLTTPETGAIEYQNGLWYGDSSTSKRDTFAMRGWADTAFLKTSSADSRYILNQLTQQAGNFNISGKGFLQDSLIGSSGSFLNGLTVGDTILIADTVQFWGNSVTQGTGVTAGGTRYTTLIAAAIGTTEDNKGLSGTTLQRNTPGDSSFVDRLYSVPNYRKTLREIVLDYGINDCYFSRGVISFESVYNSVIDTLINSRGYPRSKIILITPNPGGLNAAGKNLDSLALFANAIIRVAKNKGVQYVDAFHNLITNGGMVFISSDSVHPNNAGHFEMAQAFITRVGGGVRVNGSIYLNNLFQLGGASRTVGTLNWGNLIYGNRLLLGDAGAVSSRAGMGYNASGQASLFGRGGINGALLFGVGLDASNLNISNSSFYINANNKIIVHGIDSVLSWGNGASYGNKVLVGDGGTTSSRAGMGYNASGQALIFGRSGIPMIFGLGFDGSNLSTTNSAFYLNSSNNLIIKNIDSAINWGNSVYGNRILAGDAGSTSSRGGLGYNNSGQTSVFGRSGINGGLMFGLGFDASNLTTTNSSFFINASNQLISNNSVGVGATSPNASAALQIDNTSKGFLPPRMTRGDFVAIPNKAKALLAYDTSLSKYVFYDGANIRVLLDSATAGGVVASADFTAQTATKNIVSYTNTAADHSYSVSCYVDITAVTGGVLTTTVTYTDETNTSRTATFFGMGTTTAGLSVTGPSFYSPLAEIKVKASTTITCTTTLTVGAATFNCGGNITLIR